MTTEPGFDRRLQGLVVDTLDREVGPHPTWAGSPAAGRIAEPRRRADASRWQVRALAVAAVLVVGGAAVGAALLTETADPSEHRPTNGWVAFAARPGPQIADNISPGGLDLYMVREGRSARRVVGTDTDGLDQICPAFSPDGTRLAFGQGVMTASGRLEDRSVDLVVADVDADGNVSAPVTTTVGPSFSPPCPTWSPDGRMVAFSVPRVHLWNPSYPFTSTGATANGSQVWIVSVDDGRIIVLPDLLAYDLEWSPDGADLAIARGLADLTRRTELRDTTLRAYSIATDEMRAIGPTGVDRMSWSPDGRRIAYQRGGVAGSDAMELWVADRDGGGSHLLASGYWAREGIGPVWSPDGGHIAYLRARADDPELPNRPWLEPHEVVLVTPDGATETVLPTSLSLVGADTDASWPPFRVTWSPDGTSLLYGARHGQEDASALIVVPIDPAIPPLTLHRGPGIPWEGSQLMLPIQSWGRQPDR